MSHLSIHPDADRDLADALRCYKREAGTGVARRFLAEFERHGDLARRAALKMKRLISSDY